MLLPTLEPAPLDILFGRGDICYLHRGSVLFREFVDGKRTDYKKLGRLQIKKKQRDELIADIIQHLRTVGCRFLEHNKAQKRWVEVQDVPRVVEKIKARLAVVPEPRKYEHGRLRVSRKDWFVSSIYEPSGQPPPDDSSEDWSVRSSVHPLFLASNIDLQRHLVKVFDDLFGGPMHRPSEVGIGIVLSSDKPRTPTRVLNIDRKRAYLRQNFGRDNDCARTESSDTVFRYAYGTGCGLTTHFTPMW